jgi:serine/threonine-protein kinase
MTRHTTERPTDPPTWDDAVGVGVRPGDVLAGKYEVRRVLGAGGMGVVVEAWHRHLDERVALKLMRGGRAPDEQALGRFTREARATFKIHSAHAAKIFDVGTIDDGSPYMVMEYLEGADLQQLLERRGRLPVQESVDYVLQACEAIAEAHAHGIVHRDIKPENLFLAERPDGIPIIKVLDFGISKMIRATTSARGRSLTAADCVMGSPYYMAPEQWGSARDADHKADQWALGVVLFELLAGEPPFAAPDLATLSGLILHGAPPRLTDLRDDVPDKLECVILRCLAKAPGDRHESTATLALELGRFGSDRVQLSVERAVRVLQRAGLASPLLDSRSPSAEPQLVVAAGASDRGLAATQEASAPQVESASAGARPSDEDGDAARGRSRTADAWHHTLRGKPGRRPLPAVVAAAVASVAVAVTLVRYLAREPSGEPAAPPGETPSAAAPAEQAASRVATVAAEPSTGVPSAVPGPYPPRLGREPPPLATSSPPPPPAASALPSASAAVPPAPPSATAPPTPKKGNVVTEDM